jgi:antitoxin component YwqK of YwqJK toxin-antitoxin module
MELAVLFIFKQMRHDLSILKTRCLYVLFFLPALFFAQAKPCKAILKANRGQQLSMGDLKTEAIGFSFGNKSVYIHYRPGDDSVYIYCKGQLFPAFTASGNEITSSYSEYNTDKHYITMSDSIDPQKGRHQKMYPLFATKHVVLSKTFYPNKQTAVFIHYSLRNGKDSLRKEWYRNGFPKNLMVYGTQGSDLWDSIRMNWDSTGILRESSDHISSAMYYPNGVIQVRSLHAKPHISTWYHENGILQELSYDTLISDVACHYKKTFYPTGILKTVEYYCAGTPCLTWSIYSPEGTLMQKIKKGPLVTGPNDPASILYEPRLEEVAYVEQAAEFPGGYPAFKAYMKTALADVLCNSEVALKGSYNLHFYIGANGKPVFEGIEGQNADRLIKLFSNLFDAMPLWKAGKRQGLNVQEHDVTMLRVEEKF